MKPLGSRDNQKTNPKVYKKDHLKGPYIIFNTFNALLISRVSEVASLQRLERLISKNVRIHYGQLHPVGINSFTLLLD